MFVRFNRWILSFVQTQAVVSSILINTCIVINSMLQHNSQLIEIYIQYKYVHNDLSKII